MKTTEQYEMEIAMLTGSLAMALEGAECLRSALDEECVCQQKHAEHGMFPDPDTFDSDKDCPLCSLLFQADILLCDAQKNNV